MIPTTPAPERYTPFSCPNPDCPQCNRPGEGNSVHRSWTGTHQQSERLRCTVCDQACSERAGPLMARSTLAEETVERVLKCQRWGVGDAGTAAICGVALKTGQHFQPQAAQRAAGHHRPVVHPVEGHGGQLDAAYAKRRPRQGAWMHTAIAMGSGLLLWGDVGPRPQDRAAVLIAQEVARVRQLPVFLTEGWKASPAALLYVCGVLYRPRRRGKVGRKPTPRLVAPTDRFCAQVVKVRDQAGRVGEVSPRGVFGGPRRFFTHVRLRQLGATLQTACRARGSGTRRGLVAPRRRRTRCLSWDRLRHRGRGWRLVSLYNFVLPHQSLRPGRKVRTPAMALGLTAHVWSSREDIGLPGHAAPVRTKQMDERLGRLLTPALQAQPQGSRQAKSSSMEAREEQEEAAPMPKAA